MTRARYLAVAGCVAAMAPAASAGWLAPLPLSAPDRQALFPAVALGADGRLMAAWSRSDGTKFRVEAALRPRRDARGAADRL